MSASQFHLSWLRDDRLAPLATSALPAWLWSADATHIMWANPVGAAIFGAPTSAAISARRFDAREPPAAQITRLATTLTRGAPPRLERLREFGAGVGRALTCACSHIVLADNTPAILVVAAERAGPDMSLDERIHRLLAGSDAPMAAYATDGKLLAATASAPAHLHGATSLAALGVQALAADALASGHAAGSQDGGQIAIDRIGGETARVLIASFGVPHATPESGSRESAVATTGPVPAAQLHEPPPSSPETPTERRHPLRFVWQMDEAGRFALGSDEFIALIGPRTAATIGRPWPEMQHVLDPEGQITRAIATRDTWSGLSVFWPVDDSPEQIAVELSGLPVFDRDRMFRGYRGFGICRDLARLTTLAQRRHATPVAAQKITPEIEAEIASPDIAVSDITPQVAPSTDAHFASAQPPPALSPPAENIVPFRTAVAEPNAPALSPVERSAFRELSRKLSQRLTAAGIEHKDKDAISAPGEDDGDVTGPSLPESVPDAQPIFDKLAIGVLIYRLDQLLYANPAFLKWAGHQSLEGLVEAGGLDELFIKPVAAAAAGDDKSFTLSIDRGDKISIEGELINIHWAGEPAHALVTVAQPREPERLELAQAELAELKSILDTATDGVIVIDAQGLIVSANRSAEALFDYEELAGRAFSDLFAPESVEVAHNYLNGLTRDGVASLLNSGREVIGRVRQGGLIPLFMTIGRIGEGTNELCVVFRDVTQWKKTEQELIAAKRQAEKASSAKSDFLAKISHEIRTPLNAIIGFSEVMIEERFGPIGNERYREYLKDIHASGGHLLSLVNDLLDLSKIEAGKLELTFTGVALNDLTQQCVAIMQPQANRERIIIRTSLPHALPQVVADARSVRQIVLNLLSNSIKFTGAGGQVIVSTALNDNGGVVLRVRDTGIGMSEQDLVTALEPFRQLATSARGGSGGTGLGLPLTKALAEANRASFHITSAPKDGTLVEIAFPASRVLAG
jgi:PAS domain S-box-containing protein